MAIQFTTQMGLPSGFADVIDAEVVRREERVLEAVASPRRLAPPEQPTGRIAPQLLAVPFLGFAVLSPRLPGWARVGAAGLGAWALYSAFTSSQDVTDFPEELEEE